MMEGSEEVSRANHERVSSEVHWVPRNLGPLLGDSPDMFSSSIKQARHSRLTQLERLVLYSSGFSLLYPFACVICRPSLDE